MFKNIIYNYYYTIRYYLQRFIWRNNIPIILNPEDTLRKIIDNNLSVSRYGDGELSIMLGKNIKFSDYDENLQQRLIEIASSNLKGHLICIPHQMRTLKNFKTLAKGFWKMHFAYGYPLWTQFINKNLTYGSSFISRFYMDFNKIEFSEKMSAFWKKLWDKKDLVIVEGETTRLGFGNDLFDNANSVKRVLAPAKNAFVVYDNLIDIILNHHSKELVLIALGPTATVLAYDLAKKGIQAIDVGHIDIEYEWMKMGATSKVPIPSKSVAEVKDGMNVENVNNSKYESEIIAKILV